MQFYSDPSRENVSIRAPSGEDATLPQSSCYLSSRVSIRAPSGEDATLVPVGWIRGRCFNPRALG